MRSHIEPGPPGRASPRGRTGAARRPRAAPHPEAAHENAKRGREGGEGLKMPDCLDNQLAGLNSCLPNHFLSIGLFSKKTAYHIDAADKNHN